MRRHFGPVLVVLCLLPTVKLPAAPLSLQPYSYHEGFEGEAPQVELWAKNGDATVNFLGPSDEQAYEGKRSLKLDVTIQGGSYHYWGVKVRVPCAGKVKLSARVFVADGTTAQVGFGTNMVFPPTTHSGCTPERSFAKPTGKWELVEADLVASGQRMARDVMSAVTMGTTAADVGAYLDYWSLFIIGGEGTRAIVYVDDVKIEGEVPAEKDYQADIQTRWTAAGEKFAKRITGWQQRLTQAREGFAKMPEPAEAVRPAATAIQSNLDKAERLIMAAAKAGYVSPTDVDEIEAGLQAGADGPATIRAISEARAAGHPYLIYTPRAISNRNLATATFPLSAPIGDRLAFAGCRGEYQAAAAVVYAFEDLHDLRVSASDLRGPGGTMPASAMDVRVVKFWYQAGKGIGDLSHKTYTPELLLKDDGLVRVDTKEQQNYLRSTAPDGTPTYLLCSGKTSENLKDVRPVDAAELQPVDVAAESLKEFWVTVHIPEATKAGTYRGTLSFAAGGKTLGLPLEVVVQPFDLQPSRLIYSIYYRASLAPDNKPEIGSDVKSEEQYRAEILDMKAHGVLYPTNYQGWDEKQLRRVLDIRKEAGLGGRLYNLGLGTGSADDAASLQTLQAEVRKWLALGKAYGYDEVSFYGADEATGEALTAQKAAWKAVQEAGGKTFVAGYEGTFEAMGGLLNCAVLAGRPDPEQARKWHSVGSHAFCYANPQVGVEEPETYRRNFGLLLWKQGFDGAMDYAYQHAFHHVWNDFDDPTYRDHVFAYPTMNGVVDTIEWEGFREGVDDVRYVTTLERAIKTAPKGKAGVADEARKWLAALDPDTADLYATRAKLVEWIVKLQ